MTARYVLDKSAAYRTHILAVRERLSPLMERGLLAAGRECVYIHNIQALREFAEKE